MNFIPSNLRRARATPASITSSPSSPPMASTAIRELSGTRAGLRCFRWSRSALDRDDLAAVIMAARRAQIVRALQLAAVRAFLERLDLQRIMGPTHAALGGRSLSLRDGHFGTLPSL